MVSLLQPKRTKSVDIQAVLRLVKDYREYYQETAKSLVSLKNQSSPSHRKKELDYRLQSLYMSLPVRNWLEKELQAVCHLDESCKSGSEDYNTTSRSWDQMSQNNTLSSYPST